MIHGAGITDTGKARSSNEDDFLVSEPDRLFLVCDGVGGQRDGEKASHLATKSIRTSFNQDPPLSWYNDSSLFHYFAHLVEKANQEVYEASATHLDRSGMATTLVMAYLTERKAYVINVGDSRCYLIRNRHIAQVSEDHTLVQGLLRRGTITPKEAEAHPDRHVITKALGAEAGVTPNFYEFETQPGDLLLLCSDGLYNEVTQDKLLEMAEETPSVRDLSRAYIKEANQNGGKDNITAVCVRVG